MYIYIYIHISIYTTVYISNSWPSYCTINLARSPGHHPKNLGILASLLPSPGYPLPTFPIRLHGTRQGKDGELLLLVQLDTFSRPADVFCEAKNRMAKKQDLAVSKLKIA